MRLVPHNNKIRFNHPHLAWQIPQMMSCIINWKTEARTRVVLIFSSFVVFSFTSAIFPFSSSFNMEFLKRIKYFAYSLKILQIFACLDKIWDTLKLQHTNEIPHRNASYFIQLFCWWNMKERAWVRVILYDMLLTTKFYICHFKGNWLANVCITFCIKECRHGIRALIAKCHEIWEQSMTPAACAKDHVRSCLTWMMRMSYSG